ncbi:HpcH/HpaI aldolase/citrate lyase family protein [Sphingomonas jeddahensis]|uniref:Citrate lyase subunit beta-like protein n=1 Tax=Sphingomonas jeddahensis TaxID=1915074 RepID=A0A1V2ETY6_9SPHN|nr:CoA ester lyase [Sphingomonas jeddahensis]ONF95639.1 Citrate lyase subunit beta-like protein [Sphingomonas jeddahensis]
MKLRSLLFVPGDRPERFPKAVATGADALILDLEDSVVPERKPEARAAVRAWIEAPREDGPAVFVRVNPIDSDEVAADLEALAGLSLDGVVLPKAEGAESVAMLLDRLPGDYLVLPVASETPAAVFQLGTFAGVAGRLAGVTWGAEDLPASIGAATAREDDGSYTDPYRVVRALTLFGAHAAGVPAIETVFPDFRNLDALAAYAARGQRDGFTGMLAIHPTQVSVINDAFTPSEAEIAHAKAVIAAFDANPGAGALQLDGKMIDAPHLKSARRLLALVG